MLCLLSNSHHGIGKIINENYDEGLIRSLFRLANTDLVPKANYILYPTNRNNKGVSN
jgi:hypothetical protein